MDTHHIQGIDPAFIAGMTDASYRTATGLSQSSLKRFMVSPAHYLASTEEVSESTKAMNLGSAFHAHMLMDIPEEHYAIKDKVDGRSKQGREYNENFALENANKIIIDKEEHDIIIGMHDSIMAHTESCVRMQNLTHKELSLFGTFKAQAGDVRLKGRVDGYNEDYGFAIDIKTCEDASPSGFRKAIWDRRYDIQNCQYDWLFKNANKKIEDFFFIAVEKKPPFAVGLYRISLSSLRTSYDKWYSAIESFAVCQKTGTYPAYDSQVVDITL